VQVDKHAENSSRFEKERQPQKLSETEIVIPNDLQYLGHKAVSLIRMSLFTALNNLKVLEMDHEMAFLYVIFKLMKLERNF